MRRTKEDAALTRAAIVEGALACFDRHGIGGSTMEQIAQASGVTKGAIYHHFKGKREIFHEIREQVAVPLLDEADTALLHAGAAPALDRVEHFLAAFLASIERDAVRRRALMVMMFKCEYVGDLSLELESAVRNNDRLLKAFEAAYREAERKGELAEGIRPKVAAVETLVFLAGLARLWLLHDRAHPIRKAARAVVGCHVAGRRVSAPSARASAARRTSGR